MLIVNWDYKDVDLPLITVHLRVNPGIWLCKQVERTYLQVYLPRESSPPSQPMFFCSKWSVGKVVDYAASLAGLKNDNNVLTAKVV